MPLAEATGGPPPPPDLLPRLVAAVETERLGSRRALHRWRVASLALAAGLAAAAAAGVLTLGPQRSATTRPLVAVPGAPAASAAAGEVALEDRPWGTAVRLRLTGLPAGEGGFTAWAVSTDGRRSTLASWGPTPDGSVDVPGATELPRGRLASVVVATAAGRPLLLLAG